jgi:hypothetical protein
MSRWLLALPLAALMGLLATGQAQATGRPVGPLSPAYGAYWGAWTNQAISARETLTGRRWAVHQKYYAWFSTGFPGASENDDWANGRVSLVTWEPWNFDHTALSAHTLADIAAGRWDSTITGTANRIRSWGHPLFLRFAHEMNGNWYPWDGSHNGNDPSLYVAAWRHVHDLFVAAGATNAVWVWCPNNGDVPATSWNHWASYYPGDAYTDWVGIDGYNWGTSQPWSHWASFAAVFGSGTTGVYADYAAAKPIMIVETASAEAGGSKAQWITGMASSLQTSFPSVEAVLWFDAGSLWPIDTSPGSLSSYITAGQQDYFNPPVNWGP